MSLGKLLLRHVAGLGPQEASRTPQMKLDEVTEGEDEDKKEITAGMHCSTTHKSLLGHSPFAVTISTLREYT